MEKPRLVLQNSSGNYGVSAEIVLDKSQMVIGRDPAADIHIQFPFISRNHAKISKKDVVWCISDMGSKNGTYVNAVQISADEEIPLENGDLISLSRAIDFVFTDRSADETQSLAIQMSSYGIIIDDKAEEVMVDGILISPRFSPNEYAFLKELMSAPERIHSYDEIIQAIYPETRGKERVYDYNPVTYTKFIQGIKNDISKKLHKAGITREVIKSRSNVGYQLVKQV